MIFFTDWKLQFLDTKEWGTLQFYKYSRRMSLPSQGALACRWRLSLFFPMTLLQAIRTNTRYCPLVSHMPGVSWFLAGFLMKWVYQPIHLGTCWCSQWQHSQSTHGKQLSSVIIYKSSIFSEAHNIAVPNGTSDRTLSFNVSNQIQQLPPLTIVDTKKHPHIWPLSPCFIF